MSRTPMCFRCAREGGRAIPFGAVDRPCPACADKSREAGMSSTARYLVDNRGMSVEIDDNLCACAKWTVGELRCSCGNRRIYVEDRGGSVVVCAD